MTTAPHISSAVTAKYSPWRWPVAQAYLFGDDPDAALSRIHRDYYDWALPKFAEWARSSQFRAKGLDGMKKIGDVRVVRPLIEIADSVPADTVEKVLEALRAVLKRAGPSAVLEYVVGLHTVRRLAFDMPVYEILGPLILQMEPDNFIDMLDSSSSAARFTAGLRLALAEDMRAIPSLIEMVNWRATKRQSVWLLLQEVETEDYPLTAEARGLLDGLLKSGRGEIDVRWLEPRLFHDDITCHYSVWLAIKGGQYDFLRTKLASARPGEGRTFLLVLASLEKSNPKIIDVLRAAKRPWLQSNLTDIDEDVRLAAALALAMRGDASGLAPTMELLRIRGRWCWFPPCHKYEDAGNEVLEYLSRTMPAGGRFPARLSQLSELPISSIELLTQIASRTGDAEAVNTLRHSRAAYRAR